MKELKGIFPILSTPFHEGGELDRDVLIKEVQYALEQKPHGLSINGVVSECNYLNLDERKKILDWVLAEIRGEVSVIVGVGANKITDSVSLAKHASKRGVDAVFAAPPPSGENTPDTIYAYYKAINDAVDIPIMVQDFLIPLSDVVLKRITETLTNVHYIKEERPQNTGQRASEIMALSNELRIFCIGTQMIDELQRGVIGMMPSCVGLPAYVRIFNSYISGDTETAWKEWLRIEPLISYRRQLNFIIVAKEVLRYKGIFKNIQTRALGIAMDKQEISMLHQYIARAGEPV